MYKSRPTFRSIFTKVKDSLPTEKQENVIYKILSTCERVYIGDTKCRLETRLKEHKDACIKGFMDISAIAEHAWRGDYLIRWDDTRILQHASRSMEVIGQEGRTLHMNSIIKLALQSWWWVQHIQLLDHHAQEDHSWSPRGPHLPNRIVNSTASAYAQHGQSAIVHASKPRRSYKLRYPMT